MDLQLQLKEFIKQQNLIRLEAHNNKELGFDWNLEDFINLMRSLPPQNYGTRIQNRIIKKLNFKKVSQKEDLGDCLDNFGDNYEIKTSIIDGVNNSLNVLKIRPWAKVNYYIIAFDCRDTFKCYFFRLSKNEMIKELELLKATASNNISSINEENKNVDLRFSIDINSDNFKRWINTYYSNASNII